MTDIGITVDLDKVPVWLWIGGGSLCLVILGCIAKAVSDCKALIEFLCCPFTTLWNCCCTNARD